MNPDSYYDLPDSREDTIQNIVENIADYMLKDVPYDESNYESNYERDSELLDAISEHILDDDELITAFKSYFKRKGKPPSEQKRNVYEEAADLYEESPYDAFNEHQRNCLAFSLTYI